MNIGITGANGFIGKMLVEKHLEIGNKVHILSRKETFSDDRVIVHVGDLLDQESLHAFVNNIDILYHCAAEIKNEALMQQVNVEGTRNLVQAASGKIKHWIQLSSVGIYGPIFNSIVSENQECHPNNEYEITKYAGDQIVLEAAKTKMFSYTIIRPSIVFGVDMVNKSLFDLIRTIDNGYYFFIGNKGASANYVTVEDVVEALLLAAENSQAVNKIFIVSNWCTIEEFVAIICNNLKKPFPKLRIPKSPMLLLAKFTSFVPNNPLTVSRIEAMSSTSVYSTKKIEDELQFKSILSIEKGLSMLVQKYLNSYRKK